MTEAKTADLIDDPFASAENPDLTARAQTYFGQCGVDIWYVVLEKGVGKVTFDPAKHSMSRRFTAIKIAVDAIKKDGTTFVLEREMIAESDEWAKFTLPSLKALGAELRGLTNRYARVEIVPMIKADGTPVTYQDKKTKEDRTKTAIKFAAFFKDNADCREAWALYFDADNATSETSDTPVPSEADNAERKTAEAFLLPLWNAAQHNEQRFGDLIAQQSMVAKHFNLQSPEVQKIMKANATA